MTRHPNKTGFQQRQQKRSHRLKWVSLCALLLGLIYMAYYLFFSRHFVITNDAYVTGNLAPLKAQTSGTVIDVRIDNTQYAHQGDVLVRLDGLEAQVALEQAKADLAESVRQVETQFDQTEMLRQKLAGKEALLNRNKHDLSRFRSVEKEGGVSAQQIENNAFQISELEAEVGQIRAELKGAEALIQNTSAANNPKVLQTAAALKKAYLDSVRQSIVAPISGFIAKRNIQPGEQVTPETTLLTLVPLDYLWIEANFLENEMKAVQPGQAAEITVDLYGSKLIYHGEVLGLSAGTGSVFGLLPPDNATGNYIHIVERVPVRIGLRADELKEHPLRPGLSAKVMIDTRQAGRSVLDPLTTTPADAYKTEVYDHQLDGAEQLIRQIIEENRQTPSTYNRKF